MKKLISIVLPAYNEGDALGFFFKELSGVINSLCDAYEFEVVVVNDGSTDQTREEIKRMTLLHKSFPIKAICFSRNFGKEVALTAGIEHAGGDAVITMDSDGQHPAEKISLFLEQREQGFKIVYNQRPVTQGASYFKKVSSILFYGLFNSISEFRLEAGTTDYRLLDRTVVDYFMKFREKNRLYRGLVDRLGFSKKALVFDAKERLGHGAPTYTFKKLWRLAMDSITSFSIFPLRLVGYLGLLVIAISIALMIFMAYNMIFDANSFQFTNTSFLVILSIFLSGISLASLGMIALYIANIHEEVMERPLYILKETLSNG